MPCFCKNKCSTVACPCKKEKRYCTPDCHPTNATNIKTQTCKNVGARHMWAAAPSSVCARSTSASFCSATASFLEKGCMASQPFGALKRKRPHVETEVDADAAPACASDDLLPGLSLPTPGLPTSGFPGASALPPSGSTSPEPGARQAAPAGVNMQRVYSDLRSRDVVFSEHFGKGADTSECNKVTVFMSPKHFFQLASNSGVEKDCQHVHDLVHHIFQTHRWIAPAKLMRDERKSTEDTFFVDGHDGRHRMRVIENIFGEDKVVPVDLIFGFSDPRHSGSPASSLRNVHKIKNIVGQDGNVLAFNKELATLINRGARLQEGYRFRVSSRQLLPEKLEAKAVECCVQ